MEQQSSLNLKKSVKKHQNKSWSNMVILAIPALLLAVITLPFRYEYTLAEEDLIRMMSALVYGNVTGDKTMAGFHPYSIEFSFGWYEILYAIAPHDWLHSPDLAALLINRFGVISGLLCAWTCALYLSSLYGRTVAIAASTMFFLSPIMLPVALSGHPELGAAACLFTAGWLFTFSEETDHIGLNWGFFVGALVLLTLGLSLRAEIVLAFPFVWLAAKNGGINRQSWWTRYGLRGLVLATAFGIFMIMQRHYLSSSSGAAFVLADFVQKFMSISKIGRGVLVFIIGLGGATVLVALISAVGRTRWKQRDIYFLLTLALPSLVLFLPNPQPARHFFFPALAVCVLVGLFLERWQHKDGRVLAISVFVALMNQVLIEAAHPVIVSRSNYVLNYPSLTDRRFTPAAPSGAFMLDQRAMQINADGERREAILLAAQAPERLLVLADHSYYLIAHLIAGDPKLRFYDSDSGGSNAFNRLQSETRTIVLVEKYTAWPRDITAEVLQQQPWQHWPMYIQPSTISPFDKTEVPADRLYRLSDAVTVGPR